MIQIELSNPSFESCIKCIHSDDSEETCILRRCIHAVAQLKECYVPKKPTIEPQQKWIPCSERLPEAEKKIYWVCTDGGYQCQCRWTNINHFWTELTTDWHWHIMDVPQHSKVVAWMPLPEPYRGGGAE